jgi:hypothetical protein
MVSVLLWSTTPTPYESVALEEGNVPPRINGHTTNTPSLPLRLSFEVVRLHKVSFMTIQFLAQKIWSKRKYAESFTRPLPLRLSFGPVRLSKVFFMTVHLLAQRIRSMRTYTEA